MRSLIVLMVLFSAVFQVSCGGSEDSVGRNPASGNDAGGAPADNGGIDTMSEEELENRLEQLDAEIRSLISDKSCSSDDECKAVAYGFKACGGPEGYHIYSTTQTDEAALQQSVNAYTATDRRLDELQGGVSDCEFACRPIAECRGQCVATGADCEE